MNRRHTSVFRFSGVVILLALCCSLLPPIAGTQTPTPSATEQTRTSADNLVAEAERLSDSGSAESLRKALPLYAEALAFYRTTRDRGRESVVLNMIGVTYRRLGETQKALEYFNQSLGILRAIGDRNGEALVLVNIGSAHSLMGDLQRALDFYKQALPILTTIANRRGEAVTLNNIGRIYESLGDRKEARAFYSKALERWKELGDSAGEASTLNNLGSVYQADGDPAKASEYYQQSIQLRRTMGDVVGQAETLNNLGALSFSKSEFDTAQAYYQQALQLWRTLGSRDKEAVTLENLASVYESKGEKQKAQDLRAQVSAIRKGSRADQKPTLHILSIGINHYPHGPRRTHPGMKYPLWNLTTAVKDARDFATTLETAARGGFERVETNLLLDSTRDEILKAFEKVIREIKPQDTFIFSYSGQGFSARLRNSTKREFYLMPTDFNARVGIPGGISATLLRALFTKIQAQRRLIILDARESSEGFDSLANAIAEEGRSLAGLLERDVALVTISEGPRVSLLEGEGQGNGLLTFALLKGINQSFKSGSNSLSVKQLIEYAQSYVKRRLPTIPNLNQYQRQGEIRSFFAGNDFPLVYERPPQAQNRKYAHGWLKTRDLDNVFTPWQENPQPRQLQIEARTETALSRSPSIRRGKDRALLIASNAYDRWPALANPITDATAIEEELRDYYGFETKVITNPTKTEILAALKTYKNEVKYGEDDQLFIFIAGHGDFNDDFREGYIVAKNSLKPDPDASTYLSHSQLRNIIDQIPCRHIFLVIDACFSGTFDEKIARRGGPDAYDDVSNREFIYRKMQFVTRQFLTSGGKEYVSDGRPGHNSPFARKLLEALRSYGGNSGILTINRILSYVERVTPEPRHGEWGDNQPGSDFIFVAKPR